MTVPFQRNALLHYAALIALVPLAVCTASYAQPEATEQEPERKLEEVLVTATTGTLIRGIAPTGTNVVELDREAITIIGVTSTNDLLARVPQVTNYFGTVPVPTTDLGAPINRPNIRDLGASGASTTLVLLDGMRLPGAGFQQVSPDPSVIPPAVLERLDVLPDGASALYGSDAVGGVINFVTRREFDGVEFVGKYGTSDGYDTQEASLTGGTAWEGGSGLLSVYWTENDALLGADRDWITGDHTARGGDDFRVMTCSPGTITSGGQTFDMATLAPGENLCDSTDLASTLPAQERRTVFAAMRHDLSETIAFDLAAYYSEREVEFVGGSVGPTTGVEGMGRISNANPFFTPVAGEQFHDVEFSYHPAYGGAAKNTGEYESYNIIPEFTVGLWSDWQGRFTLNYGASENEALTRGIDRVYEAEALVESTIQTAINPYDVTATDSAVLERLADYASAIGKGEQSIFQLRGLLDGSLFSLPAGTVRLAVGAEYTDQEHKVTQGNATRISNPELVSTNNSRDIQSLFAEVFVPVLSESSPIGSIELSLSGRYDDYSDIGDTSNPKVGFNWLPFDDLVIRGNWGTSFQAPSLADSAGSVDARAQFLPISPFLDEDAGPLDLLRPTILIAGGSDGLEPEEADTWSLGFDWRPDYVEGLEVSATWYNVDYENAISVTPFFEPFFFDLPSLEPLYITNPTLEEAQAMLAGLRNDGFTSLEDLYASGNAPYLITSARRINLGGIETSGIDYNLTLARSLGGVLVTAGVAGNYILERDSQPVPGGEVIDELDEGLTNRTNVTLNLGAYFGDVTAVLTTNYKDGFDNATTSVDSFVTTNLFVSYNLPVSERLDTAQVTLNIDNVMDENPPYVNDSDGINTGHSFSVGRMYTLGLRLKF